MGDDFPQWQPANEPQSIDFPHRQPANEAPVDRFPSSATQADEAQVAEA